MTKRSMETVSSTYGRCTLTATASPVRSTPLYTWPSDAAAIGRGDSSAYTCMGMQMVHVRTTYRVRARSWMLAGG